jgi:hypothetical protein
VGFPPRIRRRLVYTDANGLATTVLRSGDLREVLQIVVSAGPIDRSVRVKTAGITGVSMGRVSEFPPDSQRAASLDLRVTRCMRRMPGESGEEVDLVRVETIAHADGQRLPAFPVNLRIHLSNGTRRITGKTRHDGRLSRVVRVPANADLRVRATPGSVDSPQCGIDLGRAAGAERSPRFAECVSLPVRGKSVMKQKH